METIGFQVADVIDLAIQMENAAAEFYKRAAEAMSDLGKRNLLLGLSATENEHAATFSRLRKQLLGSEPEDNEVDAVVSTFLLSWIQGEVAYTRPERLHELVESGSTTDILGKALEMEKEAISFYSGLRSYLASTEAEKVVTQIASEELGHVVDLSKALTDSK